MDFPLPLPTVGSFQVEKRNRSGRDLYFLGIQSLKGDHRREWLLPGLPPSKPGESRVAILLDGSFSPRREMLWDEGSVSLELYRKEEVCGEFQGRLLNGRFFLSRSGKITGYSLQVTLPEAPRSGSL